jgi:Sec-independent protein secretion pathway component TatC
MEAVIVLLAIVPAIKLEHVSGSAVGILGGVIAVVAIVLSGMIGRGRWALYAGSVFQLLVIAAGVMVPMMYVLGAIFAILWFLGIWLASKVEREQKEREETAQKANAGSEAGTAA